MAIISYLMGNLIGVHFNIEYLSSGSVLWGVVGQVGWLVNAHCQLSVPATVHAALVDVR